MLVSYRPPLPRFPSYQKSTSSVNSPGSSSSSACSPSPTPSVPALKSSQTTLPPQPNLSRPECEECRTKGKVCQRPLGLKRKLSEESANRTPQSATARPKLEVETERERMESESSMDVEMVPLGETMAKKHGSTDSLNTVGGVFATGELVW